MIEPPVITTYEAKMDYLQAVQRITGVWQQEIALMGHLNIANDRIAKMWPLTFTSEQQQAIVIEFTTRRLAR